jgi:hypothetical protein
MVAIELRRWRLTVKLRDFGDAPFSAEGLLWDNIILELSSIGPINTRNHLSRILGGQWGWEETYGDELFVKLSTIPIPPLTPLPTKPKTSCTKRGLQVEVASDPDMAPITRKKRSKNMSGSMMAGAQHTFAIPGYQSTQPMTPSSSSSTSTFSVRPTDR